MLTLPSMCCICLVLKYSSEFPALPKARALQFLCCLEPLLQTKCAKDTVLFFRVSQKCRTFLRADVIKIGHLILIQPFFSYHDWSSFHELLSLSIGCPVMEWVFLRGATSRFLRRNLRQLSSSVL